MGLESVFKLSLIMNMVDNLTGPVAKIGTSVGAQMSKINRTTNFFGNMTKAGAAMATAGSQIAGAVLAPVEATFATRRAIGELSSLGVKDLGVVEQAAKNFSSTWAGTTKAEFIAAAYDIKSGIASLTDAGVAGYTELSGITAKATKSSIAEMTNLFATGYGIYKDFYSDLSDMQFGEMFSAGIAKSVQQFKTTGSGMAQAIQTLGGSATTAQVPLEEQLSVLGMLQATMGGSEAGTKYKAFLRSAAKGGKELGLSFLDTNNQLLSMPEILTLLRGKFGETMDAAEKMELQKAFGDTEAVALIDLMYSKTGDLQSNILSLYDAMGGGIGTATGMAQAINSMEPDQYQIFQQQLQNIKETLGGSVLPTVNQVIGKISEAAQSFGAWAEEHQELVKVIMLVVLGLGGVMAVAGTFLMVFGGVGLIFTRTASFAVGFVNKLQKIPGMLENVQIMAMYAGDGIKKGFTLIKGAGSTAVSAVKSVGRGVAGFAKTAIHAAATALPGLIASVWSFTSALLANPITWVVIGIIALAAAFIFCYKKFDWFREGVQKVLDVFRSIGKGIGSALTAVKDTVAEKLGNIKKAYDEHGGGIKGAAYAALEGVKSYYTMGYTFLDKLTGGKLTEVKNKFTEKMGSLKESVSTAMEGAKQYAATKLSEMQQVYEEHGGGIKGAMAAAMEGVHSIQEDLFNRLDSMTGGRLSGIRDKFVSGIQSIKDFLAGVPEWFREAGRKIIDTFVSGIKSAIAKPYAVIKRGLNRVRQLLPFSDAREGPLSTLTLSGQRTMSTYAGGITSAADLPAKAATGPMAKLASLFGFGEDQAEGVDIRDTRAPQQRVEVIKDLVRETVTKTTEKDVEDKGVVIQTLKLMVDFSKIKELPMLLKLLREIEDYANSNNLDVSGGEGQPA
ncbi:phage tail tape measure protein [Harryflintia acetispora]|uniref:TP901 family phage tail tape measure protein n=1 Tax=Harryflintia acetispora TaxID=1849041 RepID=A0A9X8UIQ7_9FIRM|nr:phage tail tape measure protein [Harryflintia acetispora]TCL43225.1 TP901 family phage tail tape measure protein [Harryflintia acetispora]